MNDSTISKDAIVIERTFDITQYPDDGPDIPVIFTSQIHFYYESSLFSDLYSFPHILQFKTETSC